MGRPRQSDLALVCFLVLLIQVQYSVQQDFITNCADTPGTVIVTLRETDNQVDIDNSPTSYRAGLGISSDTTRVTFQTDPDITPKIDPNTSFTIMSVNNGGRNEWFLQLREPINRDGTLPSGFDDNTVFEFNIVCNDAEELFRLLKVLIEDANDNAPQFLKLPYSQDVNELSLIGSTVFQVSATDLDHGKNKNIIFSVIPYTENPAVDGFSLFHIMVPKNGYVETKGLLDFEKQRKYVLMINASDKGTPPRSNFKTLTINIVDGDDQNPIFEYPTCFTVDGKCFDPRYTTSIVTGANGGELSFFPVPLNNPRQTVDIVARDQDTLNDPIQFSIEETEPSGFGNGYFSVQSTSVENSPLYRATITQLRPITRNNDLKEIRLVLKAQEITPRRHSERAVITITIQPSYNNDTSVTTTTGFSKCSIREDASPGAYVGGSEGGPALKLVVTFIPFIFLRSL